MYPSADLELKGDAMFRVVDAAFQCAFSSPAHGPAAVVNEVAMLGRSNVGKSTFINRLCNQKRLARVSATPGRTQAANLYHVRYEFNGKGAELRLTDLPGFGFAKVPRGMKARMGDLIEDYLLSREQLKVVCLLNDCRRAPGDEEFFVRDLAFSAEKHLLIVITKTDQLNRSELQQAMKKLAGHFELEMEDLLITGESLPVAPIWERIATLLA